MIKVSVIDTIFPIGHKKLNNILINLLPKEELDLLVINSNNFFEEENEKNIKFKKINIRKNYSRYSLMILFQIVYYFKIWIKLFFRNDDILLFFTFENLAFSFANILFCNKRKILFHHNNTSFLSSKLHLFFFKFYMNSVEHIVFAEFIKKRLIELGVKENLIFVITHPIPKENTVKVSLEKQPSFFLGIGYASDEGLYKEIIEYEGKHNFLRTNDIHIVLRSKKMEFSNTNISIINSHLSEEDYENLNKNSIAILCLYPKTYNYRFSGAILDGLRNRKKIIGTDIPIIQHFSKKYPNLCHSFNDVGDLFMLMKKIKESKFEEEDYKLFLRDYDDSVIKKQLKKIICNAKK